MARAADDLISVIVPAYNAGKYISRTLESVGRQSHRNLEIIVVDDGSTDDTAACVERAAAHDNRILLMKSDHRGVSYARNRGIDRARSEYIALIDADDLWTRDKLARQFEILSRSASEVGVVYCGAAGIDDDDRIILPVWNDRYASGDVLHALIETGVLSCGSTPLIRKRYHYLAGGFDEALHLAEDWKYYTALAGVCRFEAIPECLTGYRIREDSSSVIIEPMEAALNGFTDWIKAKWPETPQRVLRERQFTIETYMAFMSTRARNYSRVPGYLLRALRTKPSELFGIDVWQFALLAIAHAAGLRRYTWTFWKEPKRFE